MRLFRNTKITTTTERLKKKMRALGENETSEFSHATTEGTPREEFEENTRSARRANNLRMSLAASRLLCIQEREVGEGQRGRGGGWEDARHKF